MTKSDLSSSMGAGVKELLAVFPKLLLIIWKLHFKVAAAAALSHFSYVWLCDPIDGSLPGSSVPGILQARTLEWVAISYSNAWKWKVKVKSLSHGRILETPWTAAYQAPPSMGSSRQEYWSGLPLPSPNYLFKHDVNQTKHIYRLPVSILWVDFQGCFMFGD